MGDWITSVHLSSVSNWESYHLRARILIIPSAEFIISDTFPPSCPLSMFILFRSRGLNIFYWSSPLWSLLCLRKQPSCFCRIYHNFLSPVPLFLILVQHHTVDYQIYLTLSLITRPLPWSIWNHQLLPGPETLLLLISKSSESLQITKDPLFWEIA